jgi:hypothetical protein
MDLKVFYQKIRQVEAAIPEGHVVVVSHDTPDGGRAGAKTEVLRATAAKLVVEGRARLASAEETAEYREAMAEAARKAEQSANANKLQLTVISDADLRALKGSARLQKG